MSACGWSTGEAFDSVLFLSPASGSGRWSLAREVGPEPRESLDCKEQACGAAFRVLGRKRRLRGTECSEGVDAAWPATWGLKLGLI